MLDVFPQEAHRGDRTPTHSQVEAVIQGNEPRELLQVSRAPDWQHQQAAMHVLPCIIVARSVLRREARAGRSVIPARSNESTVKRVRSRVAFAIHYVEGFPVGTDA